MKNLLCTGALAFALALALASPAVATNLTGTFKHPDGSLVNGKLILRLSQPAKLSDNSAQIVPIVKIFAVVNGQLEAGAFVYGNDVLLPTGTHYVARLVDSNNNVLFEQKWSITGTSLDLGSLTPTTTGLVLADPLVRNVVTSQVVQGPVTFSSPLTALSLTLNGNFNPGAPIAYDMGNPALPWRELYASRWNGDVQAGTASGVVTPPASAPTVAVDSTTSGSLDNTPRYLRFTLITLNGETPASPVHTITPSTCGSGACRFSVNASGNEWRQGAFGYRVYACTDSSGAACFRQTGFPEQLDTTGALANAHYTPGTVMLTSITLSGTAPPIPNTATIDADQVALNTMCNDLASGFQRCYGTLKYKPNPVGGYAQTGTTPLVVAWPGAKILGHGVSGVDDTTSGSTRQCTFAHVKLGCVMVMNNNAVKISGLHVLSFSNGYLLNTWGSSFNQVEIADATASTSGTLAVAPLRIKGIWYYLRFPKLQLFTNTTGTGASRGAAVLLSNASGAEWEFSGPVRWTVRDNNDVFRNDGGHSSPDLGNSTVFPTLTGAFKVTNVQVQWGGSGGTGQGVFFVGGNVVPQFAGVTHSDYNPAAGTGAFFEFGAGANAATGCCSDAYIKDSTYFTPTGNNASFLKLVANASNAFSSMTVDNVFATHTNLIDMNSLGLTNLVLRTNRSHNTCNPAATNNKIINALATQPIECSYAVNNGVGASRIANTRITGSLAIASDAASSANFRHYFWSGSDNLEFTRGTDPNVSQDKIWQSTGSKQLNFYNFAGAGTLFRVDARSGVDLVQVGSNFLPLTTTTHALGNPSLRWAGIWSTTGDFSVATGTPPFTIASATEVANLNAQKWHGKEAIDFSGALDFASIAAHLCAELTLTATGAATDNPVAPSWPAALEAGLTGVMFVSSTNTVTVRLCNITASAVDPASRTYAGRAIK